MDYEKKYKDALEWMRSVYHTLDGAAKEDAEHFFPELRESEDESVRKALAEYFNARNIGDTIQGISIKKIRAWFEKQKEQKALPGFDSMTPEEKMNHPLYLEGFDVGRKVGQVEAEQKPAEWSDYKDKIHIPYCSSEPEWSEEDEFMREQAIKVIADTTHIGLANWLKSLRLQPQGVYKQTVDKIRATIERYEHNGAFTYERLADLLGNIKADVHIADECHEILDEPHWKPSEINPEEVRLLDTTISFLEDFADKGYENAFECIDWLKSKRNGTARK